MARQPPKLLYGKAPSKVLDFAHQAQQEKGVPSIMLKVHLFPDLSLTDIRLFTPLYFLLLLFTSKVNQLNRFMICTATRAAVSVRRRLSPSDTD